MSKLRQKMPNKDNDQKSAKFGRRWQQAQISVKLRSLFLAAAAFERSKFLLVARGHAGAFFLLANKAMREQVNERANYELHCKKNRDARR